LPLPRCSRQQAILAIRKYAGEHDRQAARQLNTAS
jgi:hypothetical protein